MYTEPDYCYSSYFPLNSKPLMYDLIAELHPPIGNSVLTLYLCETIATILHGFTKTSTCCSTIVFVDNVLSHIVLSGHRFFCYISIELCEQNNKVSL